MNVGYVHWRVGNVPLKICPIMTQMVTMKWSLRDVELVQSMEFTENDDHIRMLQCMSILLDTMGSMRCLPCLDTVPQGLEHCWCISIVSESAEHPGGTGADNDFYFVESDTPLPPRTSWGCDVSGIEPPPTVNPRLA